MDAGAVSARQFAALVSEAGRPLSEDTARRWFSAWRDAGVDGFIEQRGTRGRGGVTLVMLPTTLARYRRGELPTVRALARAKRSA